MILGPDFGPRAGTCVALVTRRGDFAMEGLRGFDLAGHDSENFEGGIGGNYFDLGLRFSAPVEGTVIPVAELAIEVSTAGLRKPVGEIYPARELLDMCVAAGRPVALETRISGKPPASTCASR